ncbi:MAG: hypothetical protein R3A52_28885, partial [Polyangiales bacterium]
MNQRWKGQVVLAAALGAFGCSSDPAPTDAGVDTGVDVGTDTGADTGVDAPPPMDTPPTDTPAPTDNPQPTDNPAPTDTPPTDTPTPTDVPPDAPPVMARALPTNGSAVAISADDTVAVAVNRTAHTVSVFSLSLTAATPTAVRTASLPFTGEAETWAVVMGNDDNTASVILRRTQLVVRVSNLRTTPTVNGMAATGSEPTGLAISPTGARLYVSNWADGTVTEVNTADMTVARTLDLNPALAATGSLGTVTARRGLAHPRAVVVTNDGDGDDADETVYVTEFYSHARTSGVPADDSAFDLGRQGVIYRVAAGTGTVGAPITLGPVSDTGFAPAMGATNTGCFPNQLYAAAIRGSRLYVTSVCESPRGPVNFRGNLYSALFVVDTATNAEVPAQRVVLNQRFQALYDAVTPALPDNAQRRMPLIPNDIAFTPTAAVAYVSSYGSDAVFRVRFNDDGSLAEVGASTARFIDLGGASTAGRLPVGVAIARGQQRLLASNENTRNLSVVDLNTQSVTAAVASADAPTGAANDVNIGRRFFVTGLGRWSNAGQGWGSCEGCHPDGLSDNVTWFFAAGPRQTTSLDGTYDRGAMNQRVLNWTAVFDEVHDFELNTRGVSGGVGAIVHRNNDGATPPAVSNADRIVFDGTAPTPPQVATPTPNAGLNGSTRQLMPDGSITPRSTLADWSEIDAYVRTVRPPRAVTGLDAADVTAGRMLFESRNCGACHGSRAGSNLWTISRRFYDPGEMNNNPMTGRLRTATYTGFTGAFAALNPPSAAGTASFRISAADAMAADSGDQINCVLRAVGTFPAMLDGTQTGVAPSGVRVREVRANMTAAAQGRTGFNVPSLVGMSAGAPYFHAGNARTLEESLADTFRAHHQAYAANF